MTAILAGCATGSAHLSNPNAAAAAYRDTLDLSGRLAVNYHRDGQPQSITGSFTWNQRPGHIEIALFGPLGQTEATIAVTPGSATLTQSGKEPRVAQDIDALTQQTLGWSLPVAGLADWMQGYATDADGKRVPASPANNSIVTKDGWRLRFAEWQDSTKGSSGAMPRRIEAERSATPTSDALSMRIVIDPAA